VRAALSGSPVVTKVKTGSRHHGEASCTGDQARKVMVWHGMVYGGMAMTDGHS
jgi:hypothetical protein